MVSKHGSRGVFVVQAFSVLDPVLLVNKGYKKQEMKKIEAGHLEIEVLVHSSFLQGLEF